MVAAAMLDRLPHRSVLFNAGGASCKRRAHRGRAGANGPALGLG